MCIRDRGVKAKGYASNAANFEDTAKVVEEIHKDFGDVYKRQKQTLYN